MTKQVHIVDGKIRITLPDGYVLVIFRDESFEIFNPVDMSPDDDHRISMAGAIRLSSWLAAAMRRAAVGYAETHQLKDIPPYGDHMTLEEFKENCDTGMFTEYDGGGYYATETEMSSIEALPSRIRQGIIEQGWTHIVWFNR